MSFLPLTVIAASAEQASITMMRMTINHFAEIPAIVVGFRVNQSSLVEDIVDVVIHLSVGWR